MVAVMVIGALTAALWTGSVSPTGNGGVDAFERALLVAVGALAGSRARRWPMFIIAALAVVAFLAKPFTIEQIALKVRAVLDLEAV